MAVVVNPIMAINVQLCPDLVDELAKAADFLAALDGYIGFPLQIPSDHDLAERSVVVELVVKDDVARGQNRRFVEHLLVVNQAAVLVVDPVVHR